MRSRDGNSDNAIKLSRCLAILLVVPFGLGALGCQRNASQSNDTKNMYSDLGSLPGLNQSAMPELRAELARLVAEKATPELLDARVTESVSAENAEGSASTSRASTTQLENESFYDRKQKEFARETLAGVFSVRGFPVSALTLPKTVALRDTLTVSLERYRVKINDPDFCFHIPAMLGLSADLSFVDEARLSHHLEAINAAESLANHNPNDTVLSLRTMFRIDDRLSRTRHVVPRLNAAILRYEALQTLSAVCNHPRTSHDLCCQLLEMIDTTLNEWPSDADAWIGDRALGMHMYEMVRQGDLLSLLSPGELGKLRHRGDLERFVTRVTGNVDSDELFYLQAMREVIISCRSPYPARLKMISSITDKLTELEDSPQYPAFAAQFLLSELDSGIRQQVLDHARCEAWRLALATATGNPLPTNTVNRITGKPFLLIQEVDGVEIVAIDGVDGDESISIPMRDGTTIENGPSIRAANKL